MIACKVGRGLQWRWMFSTRPPVFGTAIDGWRYAFAAMSRMPIVLGSAFVVVLLLNVVRAMLQPSIDPDPTTESFSQFILTTIVIELAIGIAQGFLLTPVAIAVHRFVLLGEVEGRYALTPSEPRFLRFFIFTLVFQMLAFLPMSLMSLLGKAASGGASLIVILFVAVLVLTIVTVIASLRVLILFPAIAVGAPGADWRHAMEDTKGHTWRVFFIVIVTAILPLLLILFLIPLGVWASTSGIGAIAMSVVSALVGVLMLAAFAAVASKLFAFLANKLNG